MLYLWRLFRSVGVSIELPMILKIDNKGTVDTTNAKNFILVLSRPSISSPMPKNYKDTATETKKKFLKANSNVMSAYTLCKQYD